MQQAPIQFIPWPKQQEIFRAFLDDETDEILFGGSVNCGKTYALCAFLLYVCDNFPGTRWGLGRTDITNLKRTTLDKFWMVCNDFGIVRGTSFETADLIFREHKNEIEFKNGSKIILLDLYYYPSDPTCVQISGLDLTGACIDEANELNVKVRDKISERIGRWKNKEYGIKAFLFMCCNPGKNFLYKEYYEASKKGTLPKTKKYIFTTMLDVPSDYDDIHAYKNRLALTMTESDYQRQVLGNWEYDDHSDALISYKNILLLWDREPSTGTRYISADIALEGSDRLVFMVWEGLTLLRVVVLEKPERSGRDPKKVIVPCPITAKRT